MSDTWDIPEHELPQRGVPGRTAMAELQAAGYRTAGQTECQQCRRTVIALESPAGGARVLCNQDGSLHVSCRETREPVPEPLPPPPTYEQQQEKLDELMRERGLKK
jgi:hypothetical protein